MLLILIDRKDAMIDATLKRHIPEKQGQRWGYISSCFHHPIPETLHSFRAIITKVWSKKGIRVGLRLYSK